MGVWFAQAFDPTSPVYNVGGYVEMRGQLDLVSFESALRAVVAQTDALHIRIVETSEGPRQQFAPQADWAFPILDVTADSDPQKSAEAWMLADLDSAVDLTRDQLFGFAIFRVAQERFFWYLRYHHIALDGFAASLIIRRVAERYTAMRFGVELPGPEGSSSCFDLYDADDEYRTSVHYVRDRTYWKERLADYPPPATLSGRPPIRCRNSIRATDEVQASDGAVLRARCQELRISLFDFMVGVTLVYLHRLTGRNDLCIGLPVSARMGRSMRKTVGMCSNILPLRLALEAGVPMADLFTQVSGGIRQLLRHERYRLEDLRRDMGLNPDEPEPYGVSVNFMAFDHDLRVEGNRAPIHSLRNGPINDLAVIIHDRGEGAELRFGLAANPVRYDPQQVDAHLARLLTLVKRCATARPDVRVCDIDVLSAQERHQLLVDWNATEADYPTEETVSQLFEAQVKRSPEAVAVVYEGQSLTYRELNERANQLARYLRRIGITPGELVGLCLERSQEVVVGVLAILKAGGTYLPLDPAYPRDRLAFMLEDSGTSVVLIQTSLDIFTNDVWQTVRLDADARAIAKEDRGNLKQTAKPEDLAYVLYTSGSTGKPKGVEIPHQALTNFLWSMRAEPGFSECDVLLAITTLSFDISGLELLLPLIVGGRIELADSAVTADPFRLRAQIEKVKPSVIQATPATWRMLIDAGWTGSDRLTALCGGEALSKDLANELLDRVGALWNMYGPTETTIWSSAQRIRRSDPEISVGRPIANTEMYILDSDLNPVPVEVPGELFIGGAGLARGYRNRPDLTAERFLPHPFSDRTEERIYRTGDLALYRQDGKIIHLGRLDHQVKLRGYRIELGEIESALLKHARAMQALVVVREDRPGDRYLAGYVIPAEGEHPVYSELCEHLRSELPDYMVPQALVVLDAYPLTPNGKIDRKALPAPRRGGPVNRLPGRAPSNPTEKALAEIFCEVLGVPEVGIHDDFFALGGHSLLAVELIVKVGRKFNVNLPLQILFEGATIAALAEQVAGRKRRRRGAAGGHHAGRGRRQDANTPTEERLIGIWESLFPNRSVSVRDNFLELQGTQNLLESMLLLVRDTFGVYAEGLPVGQFLAEPTVEVLAQIIEATRKRDSTLLVPLQTEGSRCPLFLVHAGAGYVFFFRALAERLGKDRPVYGIRAETDSDGFGAPYCYAKSIEKVAERYIREMRTIQPEGPYRLGGACVGGVIAVEMASQLLAQGETIRGPVFLFDSFLQNNANARKYEQRFCRAIPFTRRAMGHLRWVKGRPRREAVLYLGATVLRGLINRAKRGAARVFEVASGLRIGFGRLVGRENLTAADLERTFSRLLSASLRLQSQHVPEEYGGSIVLFKTARGVDPEPLWSGIALGGLEVHQLPGKHLGMLEEPLVATTASIMAQYLGGQRYGPKDTTSNGSQGVVLASEQA